MDDFQGRRVLVTGASGGIGAATVRTLVDRGAVVLAASREARAGRRERVELPAIGLTMFGVTTPCVQQLAAALAGEYDCLVFHATGIGGQSMEKLVDDGLVASVLDVTTTEVADLVAGGIMAAGEDRLDAVIRTGVPYVGSGVLASAAAMDKAVMKVLLAGAGLPVGPYEVVTPGEWERDRDAVLARVAASLTFPVFVKPARGGSSVGISKVDSPDVLADAVELARELSIPEVVVPPEAGNFSAIGMLLADIRRDDSRILIRPLGPQALQEAEGLFREIEDGMAAAMRAQQHAKAADALVDLAERAVEEQA